MLLEERLLLIQQHNKEDNLLSNMDGIERDESGLPDKQAFKNKLSTINGFLDFYVNGHYTEERITVAKKSHDVTMSLNTRDFGIESNNETEEVFTESDIFLTYIQQGNISGVEKISGEKLASLKQELNASLSKISDKYKRTSDPSHILRSLSKKLNVSKQATVSPDKWVARHPLNFHLDIESVRSVNLFTDAKEKSIKEINLLGFFNPTLDLKGSDKEAAAILSKVPDSIIYKKEAALLTELNKERDINIVHLSMHGWFNGDDPKYSKLLFAKGKKDFSKDDPYVLYAKDMSQYVTLKNKDLIFAAACETGKISADQQNENELMGILRPLTANRNKNIILSLWKVNDNATKDFVTWFYQDLARSHVIKSAFLSAQIKTRDKYPDPYYWAAFYLSQAY